jgi:cell fate (sporulation/competence/biofilm development) regulator YmcA (YheA/YmcA/DUF963 family)
MNVKTEKSIRALQKYRDIKLREILEDYHRQVREVNDRIEEIRKERGTKIKQSDWSTYREPGRMFEYDSLGRRLW